MSGKPPAHRQGPRGQPGHGQAAHRQARGQPGRGQAPDGAQPSAATGQASRRAVLRRLLPHGGRERDERPDQPFTGYKLAHAVLSADGTRAGFAGLTLGADRVYGVVADAVCVWSQRHAPPRRWCGCGFYCLHELADARALGCATENRPALLLEVTASGQYIRYERGLRYSKQRIRVIRDAWCGCGRPGVALADAGTGLVGWRHLAPVCETCGAGRPALTLGEFAARLDGGKVRVDPPAAGAGLAPLIPAPVPASGVAPPPAVAAVPADDSPIALLTAEIALLHARLDDLQARLDR